MYSPPLKLAVPPLTSSVALPRVPITDSPEDVNVPPVSSMVPLVEAVSAA